MHINAKKAEGRDDAVTFHERSFFFFSGRSHRRHRKNDSVGL